MGFEKFVKSLAPIIAMAAANGGFKFEDGKFSMDGAEGEPLDELDLAGDVPEEIRLLGGDVVRISAGDDFTIAVEGEDEAKERMRFILADGVLSILRDRDNWSGGPSATVTITMPALKRIKLAGSGVIHAEGLADEAKIAVMGSGKVATHGVEVNSLKVKLAGSGVYKASGTAKELKISIAGSGRARMGGLKAESVEIAITGSGEAEFACDGEVDARMTGSGNVTVRGSARCKVKSFGSGTLVCEPEGGVTIENEEA